MKKRFLQSIGIAVAAVLSGTAAAEATNVVVIMPDDMSFGDYGFYNPNPKAPRTPNCDRLGGESLRLADFHVAPTCSPSRGQLLTGRYANAVGTWHTVMGRYFLRENEVTMADVFKANGYRTALFGKWHLGESYPFRPQDRGFEHTVMHLGGGVGQQPDYWGNRNTAPCTVYVDGKPLSLTGANAALPDAKGTDAESGVFTTNFFTTQAIDYMRARQEQKEPFFAFLAYNVAHGPHDMPPDARAGASARTATIENFDKNIGRLTRFLDESGLAPDTLLVFILGDNGMGSPFLRGGKGSEYEGGHRVPCFVRWPAGGYAGTPSAAREVPAMTSEIDVLPTLMDVLKLHDVPNRPAAVAMDGRSLKTLLDADPANDEPALASRVLVVDNQREDALMKHKQAAVMRDEADASGRIAHKWRLNRPSATQPWELYDVQADPLQKSDLLTGDKQAKVGEVAQSLETSYDKWWGEVSARAAEYARPIVGSPQAPVLCLYSHDWHMSDGLPPWNQGQIAGGAKGNGFSAVAFAKAGEYAFDLRRWPREIEDETTLTSTAAAVLSERPSREAIAGVALPIRSARIRVWQGETTCADERQDAKGDADGVVFKLKIPEGPASVQTWFYDADGNELSGAYYVYVGLTDARQTASHPAAAAK